MSNAGLHPFGTLFEEKMARNPQLTQRELGEALDIPASTLTEMKKGNRLTGGRSRERLIQINQYFFENEMLMGFEEVNELLRVAGHVELTDSPHDEHCEEIEPTLYKALLAKQMERDEPRTNQNRVVSSGDNITVTGGSHVTVNTGGMVNVNSGYMLLIAVLALMALYFLVIRPTTLTDKSQVVELEPTATLTTPIIEPVSEKLVPDANPQNLVVNPSFEEDDYRFGWAYSGEISKELGLRSNTSICSTQVEDDGLDGWVGISQLIEVPEDNIPYNIKASIKWSNAVGVHAKISWKDSNLGEIGILKIMDSDGNGDSDGWQELEGYGISPEGTKVIDIVFWHGFNGVEQAQKIGSKLCVDNVSIIQG